MQVTRCHIKVALVWTVAGVILLSIRIVVFINIIAYAPVH